MQKILFKQLGYSVTILWVVMLAMTTQCSSPTKGGVSSQELRRPLQDVRKAVYYSMRSKVQRKSRNNRTYFSHYHRPGTDPRLKAYKQTERALLAITILGDRRPYKVAVVYKIERLNGGKYVFDRFDKELAQHYLNKVETYLAGRPEERDLIDDFRPY